MSFSIRFCRKAFIALFDRQKDRLTTAAQLATCNLQPSTRSLLKVIEVLLHRPLIRAGDLFLAQGALGVGLRGGGRFLVGHLALAFDADAFQGNARHLAAGLELAFHLGGLECVAQFALAAVGVAHRILVGPVNARIIPVVTPLAVPLSIGITPRADAAARMVAVGIVARLVAGAHAPALARADAD